MKRAQKTDMVADLSSRFNRASMALVSEYKGMTAAESAELRRRLKAVRGELRVAKNTLVRRAIQETNYAGLDGQLGGPVGVIFSFEDPIAVAKTVTSFKEAGEEVQAAWRSAGGQTAQPRGNPGLANMPPKEVVMGQLLGVLQAPASALVRLLNEPGRPWRAWSTRLAKKNGEAAPLRPPPQRPPPPEAATGETAS